METARPLKQGILLASKELRSVLVSVVELEPEAEAEAEARGRVGRISPSPVVLPLWLLWRAVSSGLVLSRVVSCRGACFSSASCKFVRLSRSFSGECVRLLLTECCSLLRATDVHVQGSSVDRVMGSLARRLARKTPIT